MPSKILLSTTLIASLSMALVACGGSGTEDIPAIPKFAELSLAVGSIETFNGTGAQSRISKPSGIAVDSVGNTYITQSGLHSIRKISPAGVVTIFAGDAVNSGAADGAGAAARFSSPAAIAADQDNNIYVLDQGNGTVRKISHSGLVTTIAGNPGLFGKLDGKGSSAQFGYLTSIAVDSAGSIFLWDSGALRKIAIDGSVATLDVPLNTLMFDVHLTADTMGNLFIASGTTRSGRLQRPVPVLHKLTPAGDLTQVYAFSAEDTDGAIFNFGGIAADRFGNVYLSNSDFTMSFTPSSYRTYIGNTVLKLTPQGGLTTIAGTQGQIGFNDGQGVNARFDKPGSLAVDYQGSVIVADVGNGTVRTISENGTVATLAGRATASVDGQGQEGQLKSVVGLSSDQRGNVVVAEYSALRSLSPSGILTTTLKNETGRFQNIAVNSLGFMYVASYEGIFSRTYQYAPNGTRTGKDYGYETRLAVDAQDDLYGTGGGSSRIIRNLSSGKTIADLGAGYAQAFVFDASGNAYVVDRSRSNILKVSSAGTVSIFAGLNGEPGYRDGAAVTAQFNSPEGIAVLGTDVYVADTGNNLIRKISQEGNVTTVAGTLGSLDTVMGQRGSIYRPTYLATENNNSLLVVADEKAIVRIRLH